MTEKYKDVMIETVTINGIKYISEISLLRCLQSLKDDTPISFLILAITQAKEIKQ